MIATAVPHSPVLLREAVELLTVQPGGRYVDCTVGGGGHAASILEACSPGGRLLGLDADPDAIERARGVLEPYGEAALLVNESYVDLESVCIEHDLLPVQGILFDLGISSMQLDDGRRGFSFQREGPLDMRFGPRQTVTAADIVNEYPEADIACIIRKYGEEPRSRAIAKRIVASRPIRSTTDLARLIEEMPGPRVTRIHPATKTFQALRIAVNQELEALRDGLKQVMKVLDSGGRVVVIGYHSLENRIVKEFLRQETRGCVCSPTTPVCICGHEPKLRIVTKRVVRPTADEVADNPRSRSAKMRVAERL
jgi:16S rRNA (cytosine1402-N4)-methyltransferase